MGGFVYVNGEIVGRDAATVSAFDRSFLYGDGLFETVRAYEGAPFRMDEHLDRLAGSAGALGIPMPARAAVADAVARLIDLNGLGDAYVRITLSRGTHAGALAPDEPPEPTLVIEARELRPYPPELYERGARAIVSSLTHDSSSPVRRHKTTSYITNVLARSEAKERGADEAILLDAAGRVAEGATSNVFCVRGGRLVTPPLDMNILPGVTRAAVIALAREAGHAVDEAPFGLAELRSADEVFLTNSLMEVMPVRSVDGREVAGAPDPVSCLLRRAYGELIARGRA